MTKFTLYFLSIIITTLIVTVAVTPLSMAVFNRLTIQAILGNIFAIPLTAFWLMPCALLSTLSLLWGGNDFLFYIFEQGLSYLCYIANIVSQLPGAGIRVQSPAPWFYWIFSISGLLLCIGPFYQARLTGLLGLGISMIAFNNKDIPHGYIAMDRSVMAFYEKPYLWVTHLKHGSFYTKQWCQHLGLEESMIRQIPTQHWHWKKFIIITDPFRTMIDNKIKTSSDKKVYLKNIYTDYKNNSNISIISNSYFYDMLLPDHFRIDGNKLKTHGSAFVNQDGFIFFQKNITPKRPWTVNCRGLLS